MANLEVKGDLDDHLKENDLEELKKLREFGQSLQDKVSQLETANKTLQQQLQSLQQGKAEVGETPTPINEYESTLRRLVQRVAMILQAEKAVFMLFDRETGELAAMPPAYGVDDDGIRALRVRATSGVSGQVFREGVPVIVHDAVGDERTVKENVVYLGVRNLVAVPLVIEKRDEDNRLLDKQTIGVLHVFNKRHGGQFNDEDVRLLERMSRNAASIIANLQLFQEVVKEKEELEHTIDSLYAGLVLINGNGRVAQMNQSARNIFRIGQEAIGKLYNEAFNDERFVKLIEDSTKQEADSQTEITVNAEDGHDHIFQVQSALVRGDQDRVVGTVAILNDITELRTIERMKSAFVATVSHELRTPLTAIKGFVQTLLMDTDGSFDETSRREFYGIIDSECDRLTRLINDLLNISRIEAGESLKPNYKEVNVRQLAQKVLMIQNQATQKHALKLDVPEDFPLITADEDKLDQVLTNLINNSIKYSPNGGQITIIGRVEGNDILLAVKDEGMGLPKDQLPKVFEKFHRVDNRDNRKIYGTGLGLFLVKHLVEVVHQGEIWAESEGEGKGSTFTMRIPKKLDPSEVDNDSARAVSM